MSRDQLALVDYLKHIAEAIERIQRYTNDMDKQDFLESEIVQDAVIRNFEVIGEASQNIMIHYPEFVGAHPELPFTFAYQMRNAVAHGYFNISLETAWRTLKNDLPAFRAQVLQAAAAGNPKCS